MGLSFSNDKGGTNNNNNMGKEESGGKKWKEKFHRAVGLGRSVQQHNPQPWTVEQLRTFFKEHDRNGDGRLNKTDLKVAFRKLGLRAAGWRAGRAIHHNDFDLDGEVNDHEIEHLVSYAILHQYADVFGSSSNSK